MKKVPAAIALVTLFAVFYCIAPFTHIPDKLIFSMFLVAPFLVVYMAYIILKHSKPSGYTFEEGHYDDLDEENDNGKIIF